ncbi:hypothetical protein ACFLVP_04155 [Chloroflexota bacterium]
MSYWVCSICGYQDVGNNNGSPLENCPMCRSRCSFIDVAHSIPDPAYGREGTPDRRLIERISQHAHIH